MPQPSVNEVHVDAPLTQISLAYQQRDTNFVAGRVFKSIAVPNQSDKYFVFDKASWHRDEAKRRGDAEESAGSGYTLSSTAFYCDVWAMHKDVGHLTKANTSAPLDWRRNAVQFVTQRLLLRREIEWTTAFFTTSVWGTDSTPSTTWDNLTSSDPITDISTGCKTVLQNTGFEPNTLVLGYEVFEKLRQHPDIVDRIKYTSTDSITPDILGRIFEVDRVLVAKSVKNTAVENETDSYAFVHGKHALLCYVPEIAGVETPSAGYTFEWTGISDGLGLGIAVREIDMPKLRASRIEGELAFKQVATGTDLGYFFNGAVA